MPTFSLRHWGWRLASLVTLMIFIVLSGYSLVMLVQALAGGGA